MNAQKLFPSVYRVPEFVPEEFDQGDRDNCVSLSVTSLLEYCCRERKLKLSSQYLHARCRQEDPGSAVGTGIDTAFYCVAKYGVCSYMQWPTDRREDGVDAGTWIDSLTVEKFPELDFKMFLTPRNVEEYKVRLSGADGSAPMPVVLGIEIFATGMTVNNAASWYHDPLPGDNSSQNHAVLVYGWRDTPGQESAGYFVARNTFIMEKNGCRELHIPFEYLEKYAVAAGSIRIPADDTAAKITEVPAAKEENTVMNQNISSGAASNFFDTIRSNIDNGMYFYPDFRMSFFHNFTKKVNSAGVLKSEKDVSGYYREFLADRGVTSSLDTTVKLFTFQISSSSKLLLAAAFFAPQKEGAAVADQDIRQLHNYIKMTAGSSVQHTFLVLGSEFNFDSSCNASTNPAVILCEYVKHDIWTHRIPDFHAGELSRRFLVHIMPGRYAGELKNIISMHDGLSGNINLAYLKRSLVYSGKLDDESIAFALDELFIRKEYAMDRNGNILLCKDHPQLPSGFTVASRFSRPIGIIRRIYYAWNIISLLLPLLVQTTARMMHIELPWLISFGLSGLSLLVARLSWMAKLRFNYNIK